MICVRNDVKLNYKLFQGGFFMKEYAEVRFEDGRVEMMEIVGTVSKIASEADSDYDCTVKVEI